MLNGLLGFLWSGYWNKIEYLELDRDESCQTRFCKKCGKMWKRNMFI